MMFRQLAILCIVFYCPTTPVAAETVPQARPSTEAPAAPLGRNRSAPPAPMAPRPIDRSLIYGADSPEHKLLVEKLAERDRIQQEVQSLCEKLQAAQQILVKLEVLEVNRTEMHKRGFDTASESTEFRSSRQDPHLLQLLADLKSNGMCSQLAAPTIVTVSGRPASMFAGGQLPIPNPKPGAESVEYMESGTRVNLTPEALGDNKVRMAVHLRLSTAGEGPGSTKINDQIVPASHELSVDTSVEMEFGETIVLGGLESQKVVQNERPDGGAVEEVNDVAVLLVVKAEQMLPTEAQLPAESRKAK